MPEIATGASSPAPQLRGDGMLLSVRNLTVSYGHGARRAVHAVVDASFDIAPGETLSLVGESGCGKSSAARAIMQLPPPAAGQVLFDGTELTRLGRRRMRALRPRIQMIFQDPISSLNPRRRVRDIVAEPLAIWKEGDPAMRNERVRSLMEDVGLDPDAVGGRRPGEFSGGQCQRISIARALVLRPKLLVCDEPVSALDVSVQAQILNLLQDLKARHELTLLFIAHDLAVVRNVSDRVAVMYLGKLCEIAGVDDLYGRPAHPYTRALLDSAPRTDPGAPLPTASLPGELPSPLSPPSGCRFRTRCPMAQDRCATEEPPMREIAPGHVAACHFAGPA